MTTRRSGSSSVTRWVQDPSAIGTQRPGQAGAGRRGGTALLPKGPKPCPEASVASGDSAGVLGASAGLQNLPLFDVGLHGDLMSHEQGGVCPLKSWQGLVQALASSAGLCHRPPSELPGAASGCGERRGDPRLGHFPLGTGEVGRITVLILGPEELPSAKLPKVSWLLSGGEGTRTPVSWRSIRSLVLPPSG